MIFASGRRHAAACTVSWDGFGNVNRKRRRRKQTSYLQPPFMLLAHTSFDKVGNCDSAVLAVGYGTARARASQ